MLQWSEVSNDKLDNDRTESYLSNAFDEFTYQESGFEKADKLTRTTDTLVSPLCHLTRQTTAP